MAPIGAYTSKPLGLPHPKIPKRTLLIIEKGLRKAWDLLRTEPPVGFDLTKADEDRITQEFRTIVCNMVLNDELVKGFNKDLFSVHRESKHANYNGGNIDKMPDLVVEIRDDRPKVKLLSEDGLFVECKPVDPEHTLGVCYCGKGLIRFINGDYAWAMQEAMMIGYTINGYTIDPKLHNGLRARDQRSDPSEAIETLKYPAQCRGSVEETWCEAVHVSRHRRVFRYIQTGEPAPPITIRHLWLRRD